MNNMMNWIKKQVARIMVSTANVEKNAFGQSGETLESDISKVQRHTQGQLADSLVNGEVTQEVLNLKWRTYKILKATEGVKSTITGYDDNNMPIVKTTKRDPKIELKKVKLDTHDDYKLELVLDNSEIALNTVDMLSNNELSLLDSVLENYDDKGNLISVSHATIGSKELEITEKGHRPIKIERQSLPKFLIENHTKKLNVRKINKKERLLEFYISSYHDEYNVNSKPFLIALKKLMEGKKQNFLEFDAVEFLTYKTIGVEDFLLFRYEDIVYDKIVEFNGYYIVKFKAKVTELGKDILEIHRINELDEKYEKKLKK